MFNAKTKTIISIGTGGVGKTTLSAALAIGLAKQGQKILVLTIDPSQRLAQALGIKPDGEVYKVQENLFACTVNHKKVFNEFILKAAAKSMSDSDIEKLLNNKLYQQLSTQLSGSQEFTSLFKLNEFVESKKYDVVILDTPPAQHTWNFLTAPEKLARLFNEGVSQWFRDADKKNTGVFKKILNLGTQQVLKVLENLTGSEFIKELSLFFTAVQKWQTPLEKEVWACHKLLTANTTEFVLVTALDYSRIYEANKLSHEIFKQGYNLTSVIINRIPEVICFEPIATEGLVLDHINYLKKLDSELTVIKSKLGHHLKVYKSFELSQNETHVEGLYRIFNGIRTME